MLSPPSRDGIEVRDWYGSWNVTTNAQAFVRRVDGQRFSTYSIA
jgi:hypothetical protein